MINTAVSLSLFLTAFINVYAETDYITLDNFWMWSAFKYFSLYGMSPDLSSTSTSTVNELTSDTYTGTFSFTGSFSGSISALVDIAITGWIHHDSTLGYGFESYTEVVAGAPTISATLSPNATGAYSEYYGTYACVYNAQSTATNAVMTCTPSNATHTSNITLPNYSLEIPASFLNNIDARTETSVLLMQEDTVTGSITGTLGLSGSGSGNITLNGNGSITGSITENDNTYYNIPRILGTIDNSYHSMKRVYNYKESPFTVIYLAPTMINAQDIIENVRSAATSSHDIITYVTTNRISRTLGGFRLNAVSIYTNDLTTNQTFYIDYKTINSIVPLYVGQYNNIPDDLFRFTYGYSRLERLLESGTTASQEAQNNLDDLTDDFSDSSTIIASADTTAINNLDDSLEDIDLNINLTGIARFRATLNWVSSTFVHIIKNDFIDADNYEGRNIVEYILMFSLVLGLALTIIGKLRNR